MILSESQRVDGRFLDSRRGADAQRTTNGAAMEAGGQGEGVAPLRRSLGVGNVKAEKRSRGIRR